MTHVTPWLILDVLQVGAGAQIRNRKTDDIWFVIKHERVRTSSNDVDVASSSCLPSLRRRHHVTTIHRGPVNEKGVLPDHFASLDGNTLEFVEDIIQQSEASKGPPILRKTVKKQDKGHFLRKRLGAGYFSSADIFSVDNNSYRFVKSAGRSIEQLFACSDLATPLALFRHHSHFSNTIASIRIYPSGVWNTPNPPKVSLILDDRPTKLLEHAIIAERLYRAQQPWWTRV